MRLKADMTEKREQAKEERSSNKQNEFYRGYCQGIYEALEWAMDSRSDVDWLLAKF